jgi:peptidoglycan hydrolase-like protein with peptidoglycan-binding domain
MKKKLFTSLLLVVVILSVSAAPLYADPFGNKGNFYSYKIIKKSDINSTQLIVDSKKDVVGVYVKSGDKVKVVQAILQKVPGVDPGIADGIWGPKTRNAVIGFQGKNQLVKDGQVGPKTWKALDDYYVYLRSPIMLFKNNYPLY